MHRIRGLRLPTFLFFFRSDFSHGRNVKEQTLGYKYKSRVTTTKVKNKNIGPLETFAETEVRGYVLSRRSESKDQVRTQELWG